MRFLIGLVQFVLLVLLLRLLWNFIKEKFLQSRPDSVFESQRNAKKPSFNIDKSKIEDADFEELDSDTEEDSSKG